MFRKARSIARWADFTQLISHNVLNGIAAAIVYIWHSWFKCTTETSIQHIISKILNKSMLFRDLLCTLTITVFALLFAFEFTKIADSFVIQLSLSNTNYHNYSSHVSHIFYFFVIFCKPFCRFDIGSHARLTLDYKGGPWSSRSKCVQSHFIVTFHLKAKETCSMSGSYRQKHVKEPPHQKIFM